MKAIDEPTEYDQLTGNVATKRFRWGSIFPVHQIRGFRWLLLLREEEDDDDFVGGDGDGAENENNDVVTKS